MQVRDQRFRKQVDGVFAGGVGFEVLAVFLDVNVVFVGVELDGLYVDLRLEDRPRRRWLRPSPRRQ